MTSAKETAAAEAAKLVKLENPKTLGLGTGSTAEIFVNLIAAGGFGGSCLPTSERTAALARELGLKIASPAELVSVDLAVDGADRIFRVGGKLVAIKGYGGALLREKLVEYNAKKFVIMVDERKLGTKDYWVPVEIVPFSREFVIGKLRELDLKGVVRELESKEYLTDNGNLIVDVEMKAGSEKSLPRLEKELVLIPGVVETGIFTKVDMVIVGKADGSTEEMV